MLLDRGEAESFKGYAHGLMFTLAVLFVAYNVSAWITRRETHLARNSLVYGLLAVLEAWQMARHRRAR